MGWLMVLFDLPTKTKTDRKNYKHFRKDLLEDGYIMIQFSVYARSCVSQARTETHARRLREILPPNGSIRLMFITNTQWENTYVFHGQNYAPEELETMPEQLLLW